MIKSYLTPAPPRNVQPPWWNLVDVLHDRTPILFDRVYAHRVSTEPEASSE